MLDGDSHSDEGLASLALEGDRAAFEVLVRRYLRRAMAVAVQQVGSLEDAEDVVQDAFHRMVRALPAYDPERPFSPWFFTIVRNQARSALRKAGRRAELVPMRTLDAATVEPTASPTEAATEVEQAVARLPAMQQSCFRLCEVEGFTSQEIGAMLGISDGTVRTHLHRAREQLRNTLATAGKAGSR